MYSTFKNKLMLFLCRGVNEDYSFRLSADAGEYNNNLLMECKDQNGNGSVYYFSEHYGLGIPKTFVCITKKKLLNSNGLFSLERYFTLYREKAEEFKRNNLALNNFIVCTDIDAHEDVKYMFDIVYENDLLSTTNEPLERLKFKQGMKQSLSNRLKATTKLQRLANNLGGCVLFKTRSGWVAPKKRFELQNKVFLSNQGFLMSKILDVEKDLFKDAFFDSPELENFRNLFLEFLEIPSNLVGTSDMEAVSKNVKELAKYVNVVDKKFTSVYFSKLFSRYVNVSVEDGAFYDSLEKTTLTIKKEFKKKPSEKICKKDELAWLLKDQMEAFEKGKEAVLEIDEKKLIAGGRIRTIKLADLNELAGYVIIKDDTARNLYKFNPIFFNGDLPYDIKLFRNKLFSIFNNRNIDEFMKHNYSFRAKKLVKWTEAQLNSFLNPYLPNDEVSDEDVDGFLNNFTFAVRQPHDVKLDKLVTEELQNIMNLGAINNKTFEYIQTYMLNDISQNNFFTRSRCVLFFKKIKLNLDTVKEGLLQLKRAHLGNYSKFAVDFKEELDKIQLFLNDNDKQIFNIINRCDVALTTSKLLQVFRNNEQYKEEKSFLYVDITRLTNMHCIQYFKPEIIKCNLLLINTDGEGSDQDIKKLYEDFKQFIKLDYNNKLIIISSKENSLFQMFDKEFSNTNKYLQVVDLKNSFKHLTRDTQERLLQETNIVFCGKLEKLTNLIGNDFRTIIDSEALCKIIKTEPIKVGSNYQISADQIYVEQAIPRYVKIDIEIKKDNQFFIMKDRNSVMLPPEINEDILFISDDTKYLSKLHKHHYPNNNIHQLKENKGTLVWQQSRGKIDKLRKYRIPENGDNKNANYTDVGDEVINVNNRKLKSIRSIREPFVVLVAELGTGKSILLNYLAQTANIRDDKGNRLWIEIIDLAILERKDWLHKNKLKTVEDYKTFLYEGILLNADELDSFKKELFFHYFDEMKLVLLFDGFDKIGLKSKINVVEILKLIKTCLSSCWITCCPCDMQHELENAFNTFSHTLLPIETKLYLHEYWKLGKTIGITTLIAEIDRQLFEIINDNENKAVAISLQISMAAVVFKEMAIEYNNSGIEEVNYRDKQKIENKLALINLYKHFFHLKLGDESANEQKWRDHIYASLLDAFRPSELKQLLCESELLDIDYLDKEENIKSNGGVGVVKMFRSSFGFNHPTFAAYFTALWLSRNLKTRNAQNEDYPILCYFLRNHLFTTQNKTIHYCFNNLLITNENAENEVKYELHNLVLGNNINEIHMLDKNYLSELLDVKDKGDRTPLHLAAMYGYLKLCKFLIFKVEVNKRKAYIRAEDSVICWSALSYALKFEHWEICELLLNEGANDENVVVFMDGNDAAPPKKIDKEELSKRRNRVLKIAAGFGYTKLVAAIFKRHSKVLNRVEALHEAIKQSRLDTVEFLLSKQADPEAKDNTGKNSMHLAAQSGNNDVFCLLVEASGNLHKEIDEKGNTPLHYAVIEGHLRIIEHLISFDPDCNIKNISGESAREIAKNSGNPEIYDMFEQVINSRACINETDNDVTTCYCFGRRSK